LSNVHHDDIVDLREFVFVHPAVELVTHFKD
jgi:hypothetical protein